MQRAILEACSTDILFYVNTFVWTYNPRAVNKVIPFISWDFQDVAFGKMLENVEKQKDLVIEKSRDQGASWICVIVSDWLSKFQKWCQILMISRDEQMVDGKTPDALFWKIDFMHKWQPDWMNPTEGAGNKYYNRTRKHITYPQTQSTITGQASTEKAGIGGRCTLLVADEFSRMDNDYEIRDGTADTANCRIFNSTHTGPGTAFHGLCTNGVTDKLVMHWSMHPEKGAGKYSYNQASGKVEVLDKKFKYPKDFKFVMDGTPAGGPFPGLRSPWYDKECARRGSSRAIAMDLDIDVSGSMRLFFDPMMVRRYINEFCVPAFGTYKIEKDPRTGKPDRMQVMVDGDVKLWCHLKADGRPAKGKYAAGADVSQGTGATPSCLSIGNKRTGEKLLEYATALLDPKEFATNCVFLCRLFSDEDATPAALCWEQQGPGITFGGKVLELGFREIYYQQAELPFSLGGKVSERPGWVPTPTATEVLLSDYRTALATREMLNRSEQALEECLLFRYNATGEVEHANVRSKNDPSGARVNHGDRVIGDALMWKMAKGHGQAMVQAQKDEVPAGSFAWRRKLREQQAKEEEAWA